MLCLVGTNHVFPVHVSLLISCYIPYIIYGKKKNGTFVGTKVTNHSNSLGRSLCSLQLYLEYWSHLHSSFHIGYFTWTHNRHVSRQNQSNFGIQVNKLSESYCASNNQTFPSNILAHGDFSEVYNMCPTYLSKRPTFSYVSPYWVSLCHLCNSDVFDSNIGLFNTILIITETNLLLCPLLFFCAPNISPCVHPTLKCCNVIHSCSSL